MTSSPDPALQIHSLGVTFSDASGVVHALHDVSFSMEPNSFVSLIGPSGSGKSTLLRVLAGLVEANKGKVEFSKSQPEIGIVFQNATLMPWRRVIENVCLPLELNLMQDPDLLLLDEPFGSLDALTRERMGDELLHIWGARRKTVLMVTHSISEAIYLSDRVLVLSPRPGRIELDLFVDLPRPRTPEMRYLPEFSDLTHQLRDSLRVEEVTG